MATKDDVLKLQICECGEMTVAEAITVFQGTDLPFKKARKLVTGCDKTCCRPALVALFEMTEFGSFDYDELHRLIQIRNDKVKALIERLTTE